MVINRNLYGTTNSEPQYIYNFLGGKLWADGLDLNRRLSHSTAAGLGDEFRNGDEIKFLLAEQRKHHNETSDLSQLIFSLQSAFKHISSIVSRTGFEALSFSDESELLVGPEFLMAQAHEYLVSELTASYSVCRIVSRMAPSIVISQEFQGKYIVCIDPIDSRSNIDYFGPVATIFAVFGKPRRENNPQLNGGDLVASGYALYGGATLFFMNMGIGQGVNGFTLNADAGEFVLTDPQIEMPKWGRLYSVDEGQAMSWDSTSLEFVNVMKNPKATKFHNFRLTGSLATDVHRILLYGGIYMSPITRDNPGGTVSLLYGAIPLAALIVEAGGLATSGRTSILDIVLDEEHQTTPLFLGSRQNVTTLLEMIVIDRVTE